jgi:D-sedoheptulose 7-phosphate isomerase
MGPLSDLEKMIDQIREIVADSLELKKNYFAANEEKIARLARVICNAFESGNKILLFGNGGSAADAQHIASEWIGHFLRERKPLPAIALTTDTSILTSISNDYGFEHVFSRQVRALGRKGDVAIGISTSGNSSNVLEGIKAANELGLVTVGLTGRDGGRIGSEVQYLLNVPHTETPRIQEIHTMTGHILCELVDDYLKGL